MKLRPFRRLRTAAVAVVAVAVLGGSLAEPASAAGTSPTTILPAVAPTTTTVPKPAPTTTTVPKPAPTTTTVPKPAPTSPSTTAARPTPPTTGSKTAGPPSTGVPQVQTSGGPTTTVPPGTPTTTPPPVNIVPSVEAVDAALDQLAAISNYANAQAAVPAAQAHRAGATAALLRARSREAATAAGLAAARRRFAGAHGALANLALAAYTGEAYAVPGLNPSTSPSGTVSQAASSDPSDDQDAEVLLGLIVQHTKSAYSVAKAEVARAESKDTSARRLVAAATSAVTVASHQVTHAQAALVAATQAATVPGAALAQVTSSQLPATQDGASPQTTTTLPAVATIGGPSILGPSVVTAPELAAWYSTTGMKPATTVPVGQLAADYMTAGRTTGVRGDLAWAQSIIETGYFSFPGGGQLTGTDNNFAGIGACDSCTTGFSFPDALTGVTAQMQLLEAYASPTPVATPLIGNVGVGGCCTTWSALAGKWASNPYYGVEILSLYAKILDWVIPQRLLAIGLPAPAGTVPAPPGTEPTGPSAPLPVGAAPTGGPPTSPPTTAGPPPHGASTTTPPTTAKAAP